MIHIESNITFGNKYEDKVTGLVGVATGIVKHQFGCVRIGIQPKAKEDGTVPEVVWIDEASLVSVTPVQKEPGGPAPNPKVYPTNPKL